MVFARLAPPSYLQDYARYAGVSASPHLLSGMQFAWGPFLGPGRETLISDISPGRPLEGILNGSPYKRSGNPRLPGYVLDFQASLAHQIRNTNDISAQFSDAATLFIVVRLENHTPSISSETGGWVMNASSATNHYPFTTGSIFDGTFITTRQTVGAVGITDRTQWHDVIIVFDTGEWTFHQNNQVLASVGGQTFQIFTTENKRIANNGLNAFEAEVSLAVLWNRALNFS